MSKKKIDNNNLISNLMISRDNIETVRIALSEAEKHWYKTALDCEYSTEDPDAELLCDHKKTRSHLCYDNLCPLIKTTIKMEKTL
jgi:hypothetical protein